MRRFVTPHKRIAADLWANSRLRTILRLVSPTNAKVLDLGCGPGYMGNALARLGNDVYYADISREELDSVDAPDDHKILCDATAGSAFEPESFDWVLCGDLLEHVKDDIAVLRNIRNALKTGGRAVITVPAHTRMYGHHDKLIGHLRRYDRAPFREELISVGFSVIQSRFLCSLLFFPFVINQILLHRDSTYKGTSKYEEILMGALNLFSELDSRVRLPFGVGLVFIVEKQDP